MVCVQVSIERVFGSSAHAVVAKLNIEGQHRGAVAAVRSLEVRERRVMNSICDAS